MIGTVFAAAMLLQERLTVEKSADQVVIKSEAREIVRYQLRKPADSALSVESACYFHPLSTPSGAVVTEVAPSDHKHHRGIFLAWLDLRGPKEGDFWGADQFAPVKDRVILNRQAESTGPGSFVATNEWTAEGQALLGEKLEAGVRTQGTANVLDLVYTLTAPSEVTLPRRAIGGFCLRMRKDGKATIEGPEGEVKLATPHHLKPETDWPREPWYACQIALPDGLQIGGAVIDHPKNPPSLWFNAVSIRMLHPSIVAPEAVVIKGGSLLVLRYRVVAWDGPTPRELLQSLARDWVK